MKNVEHILYKTDIQYYNMYCSQYCKAIDKWFQTYGL